MVKTLADETAVSGKMSFRAWLLVADGSLLQGACVKGIGYHLPLALDWSGITLHEVCVTDAGQGERPSRYRFAQDDVVLTDHGCKHTYIF